MKKLYMSSLFFPIGVLATAMVFSLRSTVGKGFEEHFLWSVALFFVSIYAALYYAQTGRPLLKTFFLKKVQGGFNLISSAVNKPMILTVKKKHHLFLSYGLLQGLGAMLAILYLKFFFEGSGISLPIDTFIIFAMVPILLGNRLAGLFAQIFAEGLTFREAVFRVRFLSVGIVVGLVFAVFCASLWWKVPVAAITDGVFTSIMWTQVLGSIGCVFYGCCHGEVRNDGIGVRYSHPSLKPNRTLKISTVCVTPTTIYCALFGALILAISLYLRFRLVLPVGFLTAFVGTSFALFRNAEEWFRFDTKNSKQIFSMNHIYVVALVLLSLGIGLTGSWTKTWQPQTFSMALHFLTTGPAYLLPTLSFIIVSFIYSYHRGSIGQWK